MSSMNPLYDKMREIIALIRFRVMDGNALKMPLRASYIDFLLSVYPPMERRVVPLHSKPVAITTMIKNDEYGQSFGTVSLGQSNKHPVKIFQTPEKIAKPIWVARRVTIPEILETVVLDSLNVAGIT